MTAENSSASLRRLCQAQLEDLSQSVQGLQVAVIASADGFPLASLNLEGRAGRNVTAMGSRLCELAQQISSELTGTGLEATTLETGGGLVLCRQVENSLLPMLLIAVVGREGTGGYTQWMVRKAAQDLADAVGALATTKDEPAS